MTDSLKELYLKFTQEDIESLYYKGRYHIENKNFELAGFYFSRMVAEHPRHFWAVLHLAEIAAEQKLFTQAVAGYQQALTLAKSAKQTCIVNCGLAAVFVRREQFDLAEHYYLQGLEQYPDYVFFYTGLAELYKLHRPEASERIVELYQQALALEPHLDWIDSQLKIQQRQVITESAAKEKKVASSVFQLYSQGQWVQLFTQEDTIQYLRRSHVSKEIIHALNPLSQDAFASLSDFYCYVADRLTEGFIVGDLFANSDILKAAAVFLMRAIKTSVAPGVDLYVQTLNVLGYLARFAEAEAIALQALLIYGDQAELLLAIARLMNEKRKIIDKSLKPLELKIAQLVAEKNISAEYDLKAAPLLKEKAQFIEDKVQALAASRLLFGEAVSIAPEKLAERDWADLMRIHNDLANQGKAKKFGNLKKFLLESPVAKQVQALDADFETLAQVDAWLHELSVLTGDFSVEVFFDLTYYCEQTQLWFATVDRALAHYFLTGWQQHVAVHPSFDDEYVRRQLQGWGKPCSAPALLLFLRHERELGIVANILFDSARLTANTPMTIASPWLYYLAGGWQTLPNPSEFFDIDLYLQSASYPTTEQTGSALVHFLKTDSKKDCNRLFHTLFYIKNYKPVLRGKPAIVHYLTEGAYEGYLPNPFFRFSTKTGLDRIDYLKLPSL